MSEVLKFGKATVNTSPTTIASFLSAGSLYVYPASAGKMYIISDSTDDTLLGDGARTVQISGLDSDYLEISEIIEMDGTTQVVSTLDYLRIYRMQVLEHGNIATTGTILVQNLGETESYCGITEGNQSQMAAMTIPAGHIGKITNVVASTYGSKKTNVYFTIREFNGTTTFNIKNNWNMYNNILDHSHAVGMEIPAKADIEMRAYTESVTDSVSCSFHISIEPILDSALDVTDPVAVTSFVATAGDGEVSLAWDVGTSDYIDIRWSAVGQIGGSVLIDGDEVGYTVTDLENDVEYTFYIKEKTVRGDSGPESSDSATPAVVTAYVLGATLNPTSGTGSDGLYLLSEDSGVSWSDDVLGAGADFNTSFVATNDTFSLLSASDAVASADSKLYETTDGSTWSLVVGFVPGILTSMGDLIVRNSGTIVEASSDNIIWDTLQLAASDMVNNTFVNAVQVGTDYYAIDQINGNVIKSSDGINFINMTNQPAAQPIDIATDGTSLMVVYGNAATITSLTYEYTTGSGDVAWTVGGASNFTATEMDNIVLDYFGGLYHMTSYEADFGTAYYETSTDGVAFSDVSSRVPSPNVPLAIMSDGTTYYMSLVDVGGGFVSTIQTSTDGTTWGTPVTTGVASTMIIKMDGKD